MNQKLKVIRIKPGAICVYATPVQITSVISYGIAVSLFDPRLKIGGLCHFLYPQLPENVPPTGKYAIPALFAQIQLLKKQGSNLQNLEANLYGGTDHPSKNPSFRAISKNGLQIAIQYLRKNKIKIGSLDFGGATGRKLMFNVNTGETMIAKVRHLELADWQCA
ncbi:MAG: hypothetical protein COA79_01530 [Planctomycetota bacterium]|nr:MAG: hypothetical protein COA79_01530 [Planctomycetota bacterium]